MTKICGISNISILLEFDYLKVITVELLVGLSKHQYLNSESSHDFILILLNFIKKLIILSKSQLKELLKLI